MHKLSVRTVSVGVWEMQKKQAVWKSVVAVDPASEDSRKPGAAGAVDKRDQEGNFSSLSSRAIKLAFLFQPDGV